MRPKYVTKRDGKYWWLAIKDDKGYHCVVCYNTENDHYSQNIKLAGSLYTKQEVDKIKTERLY